MEDWFEREAEKRNPGAKELQLFVEDVASFLGFVVRDDDFSGLWRGDPDLRKSAEELLATEIPRSVQELMGAISEMDKVQIRLHGLSGAALRFKLRVVRAVARRWKQAQRQLRAGETFRKLVEAIDALLDLIVAAAGGAGGLLKEFKDALSSLS